MCTNENLLQSPIEKRAQELRKNSTLSEVLLWQKLKDKQLMGYDFHRQKPIDEYIVDFFCSNLAFIIEIDGETHNNKCEEDRKRQKRLESLGFRFLHFLDKDVKQNIEGVLLTIEEWIKAHP
jgi:very-short-patch-repair endonuclease